jgi:putative peptidoglycan lipid II flippase
MNTIKKIFKGDFFNSQPSKSVASAALIITAAGIASRVLGLFRDRFLASTFGAGDTLDVYYAAFRIPDLVYNLLILGALSAAFIPVFTGLISRKKDKEAWEMANGVMNLAIFFIIVLSLVLAIFAPFIMKIITPGFSDEKLKSVVFFTRIMFFSPLFLGISGIFGGILTSFRRFLIYSFAPIFYNLGIIVGVLYFVKFMGPIGLAWGVVFGAILHMSFQWPAVHHTGFKFLANFKSFRNKDVKKVIRLMLPRTLGIAVNQVNLMVITIFASLLSAGSLAIFNFAQNLQGVPLGIFGSSFAIAVFPSLAACFAKEEKKEFVAFFSQTFRQILFFVIPISIFILVLRAQIVRVVLGSGKFDWEDTILTFQALGIFALSLFAQSLVPLLARAFYAMHDTKTPFYIALVSEAINITLVLILIQKFALLGLVMAFSVSATVQMFLLLFVLRTRFENLGDKEILKSVFKISIASVLAGLAIQGSKYLISGILNIDTFLGIFGQLLAGSAAGLAVFISASYLLNLQEFFDFKKSITKKIFRQKSQILEDTGDVSGIL